VLTTPCGVILRIAWLPVSATYRLPSWSKARPDGVWNAAAVPAPSAKPSTEPAIVVARVAYEYRAVLRHRHAVGIGESRLHRAAVPQSGHAVAGHEVDAAGPADGRGWRAKHRLHDRRATFEDPGGGECGGGRDQHHRQPSVA
jgi:hypothetical protein